MKTRIRVLLIAMSMVIFSSCGGSGEAIPAQPRGTLAAIEYSRTVDMIWGENYSVRVNPGTIESIDFFVEKDRDYRFETSVSLNEGQWQELETTVLELLPGLTEIKPKKESLWMRLFQKTLPLPEDGADSSTLSFDWETADGIVSVRYSWKHDDPKAQKLISLLKALQQNIKGE